MYGYGGDRLMPSFVYADIADSAEFFFMVAFVMDDLSSHELSVHYYIR